MDDEIRSLLSPWEDYQAKNRPGLYVYEIAKQGQILFGVGSYHIYSPVDPNLDEIYKYWVNFVDVSNRQNCALVVEKTSKNIEDFLKQKFENSKDAVLENAEPGYLMILAANESIDVMGFEPSRKETIRILEKNFENKYIFYHKIAQMTAQWHRMRQAPAYIEFIQSYIDREKESSGWEDFEFSLDNFKKIHRELFNSDFDLSKRQFFSDISDPSRDGGIINKVARENSTTRDIILAKNIIELWNKGKNIFVLYGNSHVINIEPVLRRFCI